MKFSQKNFENWRFWKMHFFWVGHFEFFFSKKKFFFAFFPWKLVKVYWLARMGQNFDQAKCDNNFGLMPNILKGSVLTWDFSETNWSTVHLELMTIIASLLLNGSEDTIVKNDRYQSLILTRNTQWMLQVECYQN